MAQQSQEQSKSEQATPFKLQKAREKGSVARGTDLGFAVSLAVVWLWSWMSGAGFWARLEEAARTAFVAAPQAIVAPSSSLIIVGRIAASAAGPLAWLAIFIFAAVLVMELIQTGPVFTFEPFKPDFSRLSPATGLKRIFSVRLLIETAKSILKLAAYVGAAALTIAAAQHTASPTIADAPSLAHAMGPMARSLLAYFLFLAVGFAAFDQFIARGDFRRRMRMTRRDVRRELRDREGEPRMKQRRRQLHREYAKLSQGMRNIKAADVLITNPNHYAVALQYDPGAMLAPNIVAQASNQGALRLKRLALTYGVVVIQNPPLARSLFFRGQFNKLIPEAYFREVATIYIKLQADRRRAAQESVHA